MIISYKDFFDFEDTRSVNEIITFIDKLDKSYSALADHVKKDLSEINKAKEKNIQVTKEWLKISESINIETEKGRKQVQELSANVNQLTSTQAKLISSQKQSEQQLKAINTETERLKKSKEELKKSNVAEAGSLASLKKELSDSIKAYEQLGDSADKSIKDEQLKKVKELSNQYSTQKRAIDEAKKATDFATGSYNALNQRLIENKRKLKDSAVGINITEKEFENLRKEIKKDSDTLKEFDNTIGDNQRKVGDYAGQIGQLIPGFSGVSQAAQVANKSLWAIVTNPIGAIIAAIALAIGGLMSYFKSSAEGAERWNKVMNIGKGILELFTDGLSYLGKLLVGLWNNPIESLKNFGDSLKENILNRFKSLQIAGEAFVKLFKGDFKAAAKDFGNAWLQGLTGVENLIDKTKKLADEANIKLQNSIRISNELSAIQKKLASERIKDIIDDAQTELKISELLEKSKDKLRISDEKRLEALLEAKRLSIEQTKGDIELVQLEIDEQRKLIEQKGYLIKQTEKGVDLLENENALRTITKEEIQKLVELEAKQLKLSEESNNKKRAFNKMEIQLMNEIESEYRNQQKRRIEADKNIYKFQLNEIIKKNDAIIKDERSTQEEVIIAINKRYDTQNQLLEENKNAAIKLAEEEALAKVEITDKALAEIYANEEITAEKIINAKEKILITDENLYAERKILQDKINLINEDYESKILETDAKLQSDLENNVFTFLLKDFENLNATIKTQADDTISSLTAAYGAGLDSVQVGDQLFDVSSYEDFENSKTEILRKAEEERLRLQLNYALDQLLLLDTTSKEYLSKKQEIANLENQLSNNLYSSEIEKRKKFEEDLKNLTIEFKQAAVSSALTIVDNANAAEDQKRAERLERLQQQQEIELTLAGNNEVAKADILNKFAAEEEKIRQQQAAANRKRAVFEKVLAGSEIGIKTALGIANQLPGLPFTAPIIALIAGIGSVQLAAVLSKPIPAFATGTDYSPEGLAIVNENGRELITEPSGKSYMLDSEHAALTYLKKGSKVYTADETKDILSGNHFDELGRSFKVKEKQDDQRMILAMSNEFGKLNKTIKNKKEVHLNITKDGVKTIIKDNGSYIEYLNNYYA